MRDSGADDQRGVAGAIPDVPALPEDSMEHEEPGTGRRRSSRNRMMKKCHAQETPKARGGTSNLIPNMLAFDGSYKTKPSSDEALSLHFVK